MAYISHTTRYMRVRLVFVCCSGVCVCVRAWCVCARACVHACVRALAGFGAAHTLQSHTPQIYCNKLCLRTTVSHRNHSARRLHLPECVSPSLHKTSKTRPQSPRNHRAVHHPAPHRVLRTPHIPGLEDFSRGSMGMPLGRPLVVRAVLMSRDELMSLRSGCEGIFSSSPPLIMHPLDGLPRTSPCGQHLMVWIRLQTRTKHTRNHAEHVHSYLGHFSDPFIQTRLNQRFIHPFTHRRRSQPHMWTAIFVRSS